MILHAQNRPQNYQGPQEIQQSVFIRKAFLSRVGERFYTCEITYKFLKLNNLCSFGKYLTAGIRKFVGDFTRALQNLSKPT